MKFSSITLPLGLIACISTVGSLKSGNTSQYLESETSQPPSYLSCEPSDDNLEPQSSNSQGTSVAAGFLNNSLKTMKSALRLCANNPVLVGAACALLASTYSVADAFPTDDGPLTHPLCPGAKFTSEGYDAIGSLKPVYELYKETDSVYTAHRFLRLVCFYHKIK